MALSQWKGKTTQWTRCPLGAAVEVSLCGGNRDTWDSLRNSSGPDVPSGFWRAQVPRLDSNSTSGAARADGHNRRYVYAAWGGRCHCYSGRVNGNTGCWAPAAPRAWCAVATPPPCFAPVCHVTLQSAGVPGHDRIRTGEGKLNISEAALDVPMLVASRSDSTCTIASWVSLLRILLVPSGRNRPRGAGLARIPRLVFTTWAEETADRVVALPWASRRSLASRVPGPCSSCLGSHTSRCLRTAARRVWRPVPLDSGHREAPTRSPVPAVSTLPAAASAATGADLSHALCVSIARRR